VIERKKTGGLTPAADALLHTDIPVIAAINGPAVGWGMELALMADIRVASERAKFGELFVVRGLCCDAPGLGRLAQLVGRETAAELLFTGDVIDAHQAKILGLVGRVVPHDDLMSTAMEIAHKIARNPPLAVQALKAGLRRTTEPDWRDTGRWAIEQITRLTWNRRFQRRCRCLSRKARTHLSRPVRNVADLLDLSFLHLIDEAG